MTASSRRNFLKRSLALGALTDWPSAISTAAPAAPATVPASASATVLAGKVLAQGVRQVNLPVMAQQTCWFLFD